MTPITREALVASIAHWKRMIAWAEKQPLDLMVDSGDMMLSLDESWFASSCPLCKHFAFEPVNQSKDWTEWRTHAAELVTYMEGLL